VPFGADNTKGKGTKSWKNLKNPSVKQKGVEIGVELLMHPNLQEGGKEGGEKGAFRNSNHMEESHKNHSK